MTSIILILVIALGMLVMFFNRNGSNEQKRKLLTKLTALTSKSLLSEADRRDMIVRLDTILSKAFQLYYRNNDTCGNNLKRAKELYKNELYNTIWTYHKMRNSIVHENIDVSIENTKKAIRVYEKAIFRLIK